MRRRAPGNDKNAVDARKKKDSDESSNSNSDDSDVSDSDIDENVESEIENDDNNGASAVSEEEEDDEEEVLVDDSDDDDDDSSVEEEQQLPGVEEEEEESTDDDVEAHTTTALKNNANGSMSSTTTLDLRNLLALSTLPLDPSVLYKNKNNNSNSNSNSSPANESFLLQQAQSGCQELLHALWQLPVERRDSSITAAGPLALLPTVDASHLPRALPPPPPKQDTKWEKFAREKGIGKNKDKRSAKVWDEATGEWMYRHGYQKANSSDSKEWPIMEAVPDDPMADPWERTRQAKRARVDKNAAQQLLNQERAGMVAKGSAKRLLKAKNTPDQQPQQPNRKNTSNKINSIRKDELPVGLPVDLAASGRKGNSDIATTTTPAQRGPTSTKAALRATQVSTASLGKFDALRQDEPARRAAMNQAANKKRKFQSGTDKAVLATESERSLKVWQQLNRVGGGKTAEVARKKGRLAKGETAYDYDYSDGLGASSFRKKKGRAGAGKMKKMTKKRAK